MHGIIKGIGVVNCLYYNPDLDRYWLIDYRIFAPDFDGKSKLDHVMDMLWQKDRFTKYRPENI